MTRGKIICNFDPTFKWITCSKKKKKKKMYYLYLSSNNSSKNISKVKKKRERNEGISKVSLGWSLERSKCIPNDDALLVVPRFK